MTQSALHSTPRPGDVLREQVLAVGFALRRPAAVASALAALVTVLVTADLVRSGEAIGFHPEDQMLPGVLGMLLPIGVWRGEERFGASFLWTLPVDRRLHALAKVFGGWVWLMAAVALFVLWQLALTLLSGGSAFAEETLRLLPFFSLPGSGALDAATLQTVRRAPEPLLWIVPFTAATGTYVLASALALGVRRPLEWVLGVGLAFFLVFAAGGVTHTAWLADAPGRLLEPLVFGPHGLDTLLTARTESLKTEATLTTGERVVVWRALPDLGRWATATLLWSGAGFAALWVAASRHGERRRA